MPRYRFDFPCQPDVSSVFADFPDAASAEREARQALAEHILDHLGSTSDCTLDLFDDSGVKLMTIQSEERRPRGP